MVRGNALYAPGSNKRADLAAPSLEPETIAHLGTKVPLGDFRYKSYLSLHDVDVAMDALGSKISQALQIIRQQRQADPTSKFVLFSSVS